MRISVTQSAWTRRIAGLLLAMMVLPAFSGCSRKFWREQAEGDTYRAISEKLTDERWQNPRMNLTPDPRSRFYDPYDPDKPPLPPDDPAAHQFMHCVDGKEHFKYWHAVGDTVTVENPAWLEPYEVLLNSGNPVEGHELVEIPKVDLAAAVDLTYIHSREYQFQVEEVYLRALALTQQRFQLNTQFNLVPAGFGGANLSAGFPHNGGRNATLLNGLGVQQRLPAGGQFAVGVLNSITWRAGQGMGSAPSLGWSITQPLLNLAGRKVTLENLTQSERNLLYEVRDMARFRQVLFTNVANDYLRLQQSAQNIINAENNIRQIEQQIEVGRADDDREYRKLSVPLVDFPEDAEIPESLKDKVIYGDDFLTWLGVEITDEQKADLLAISDGSAFQAAAQELIQLRETETINLTVLQLVTRLNQQQNALKNSRRQLRDQLDAFKIRLGLPPNVELTIDDTFITPFELIDADLLAFVDKLNDFAKEQGPAMLPGSDVPGDVERSAPDFEQLKKYVATLVEIKDRITTELDQVKQDFVPVRDVLDATSPENLQPEKRLRAFGTVEERERVIHDVANDLRLYRLIAQKFEQISASLDIFNQTLQMESVDEVVKALDKDGDNLIAPSELPLDWNNLPSMSFQKITEKKTGEEFLGMVRDASMDMRERLVKIVAGLQVVQAGLRVEVIALNPFTLPGSDETPDLEEVVVIAINNRHDLMNARAAVMDSRRKVEIAANALMAKLDVTVGGQVDPDSGNNDSTNVTIDFKTPLNQVVARNVYNAALIDYQRDRRSYMSLEDSVKQSVRSSWRQLMVNKEQLEIDRETVRISALQYDNVASGGGGGGGGNALNLLNALSSVLTAQNSLVSDWVSYESNRLNIFRDMGIMELDPNGVWEDEFYQLDDQPTSEDMPASSELFPELQSDTDLPSDATVTDPEPAIPVLPEIP